MTHTNYKTESCSVQGRSVGIPTEAKLESERLARAISVLELEGALIVSFFPDHPMVDKVRETCLEENDHNHFHFDREYTGNALDDYCINRWVAEAVRASVMSRISESFPSREIVSLVLNELTQIIEDSGREEIVAVHLYPTLRIWSAGLAGDRELRSVFLADHINPDLAWLRHRDISFILPICSLNFQSAFLGLNQLFRP